MDFSLRIMAEKMIEQKAGDGCLLFNSVDLYSDQVFTTAGKEWEQVPIDDVPEELRPGYEPPAIAE